MNVFRPILLGTTVVATAFSSARAADLPTWSKVIDYVRACSLYGAGFYYIPGTDACLRIGGGIRIAATINGGSFDVPFGQGGTNASGAFNRNYYTTRERLNLFVDTRTATDYGVVRTYANMQLDYSQGRESIAGGFISTDWAFIQFAGFTFGKAVSMFDPQWTLARPWTSTGFSGGSNDVTGIPMLAYTGSFGSGLSATIALEDAQPYRSDGVINTSVGVLAPFGAATNSYGTEGSTSTFLGNVQIGDHVPDVVANLRIDQAWGSVHVAAAAHEVHGSDYNVGDSNTGHPPSAWGGAATGAFELKNLLTGSGDSLKVEAAIANGAPRYVFGTMDISGGGRYAVASGQTMAFGYVLDGIYSGLTATAGTRIVKSNAWDVSAFYEHYWTPQWRTSVFSSYSKVSYGGGNAALLAMANGGLLLASAITSAGFTTATGTFDFGIAQIGTRTAWTPVQNLSLSTELIYTRLEQHLVGTYKSSAIPGYASGSVLALKDQNCYNGVVQILRSF